MLTMIFLLIQRLFLLIQRLLASPRYSLQVILGSHSLNRCHGKFLFLASYKYPGLPGVTINIFLTYFDKDDVLVRITSNNFKLVWIYQVRIKCRAHSNVLTRFNWPRAESKAPGLRMNQRYRNCIRFLCDEANFVLIYQKTMQIS